MPVVMQELYVRCPVCNCALCMLIECGALDYQFRCCDCGALFTVADPFGRANEDLA